MSKPLMLWVDCVSGIPDPDHRARCAASFEIIQVDGIGNVPQAIGRHRPGALCFEFDYPDQQRLQAMQAIKNSHPRLPILMLTVEHSEALAVWAFRARVWNYLVKPVPPAELSACLDAIANLCHRTSAPRAPQPLPATAPSNLRVVPIAPEVARLQPALHYVSRHYHEGISVEAAARKCGLTRFEFSRRFRAAFGMTFRDYQLRARIIEARRLLISGSMSVTGVAYSVGFNDGSHFARMFKRFTGVLPSDYRDSDLARAQLWQRRATDRGESLALQA